MAELGSPCLSQTHNKSVVLVIEYIRQEHFCHVLGDDYAKRVKWSSA